MGEFTEMVLSGELFGCSLCEDLAFENYNEVNKLKEAISWYFECREFSKYMLHISRDSAYFEALNTIQRSEIELRRMTI